MVVEALDAWSREAVGPGLRRVPAGSLHVTLAFLGEQPDEEAPAIGAAVAACAHPVAGLRLGAPVWLPPRRPGVLALDVVDEDGACARLQASVAGRLTAIGACEEEHRAFRPHVTVARTRRGAAIDRGPVPPAPDVGPFAGASLTLYRSVLGAPGARYEALTRVALGP